MTPSTRTSRSTAWTAGLLLLFHIVAGAAAPLADAQEPETAPAAFEAHHDARCVVLHDAIRCAICQYAASLAAPPRPLGAWARVEAPVVPATRETSSPVARRTTTAARPRAPPTALPLV